MSLAKRCGKCKEVKPLEQFHNSKSTVDGKGYRCKPCDKIASAEYKKANPTRAAQSMRRRNLMFNYGLTEQDYNDKLASQKGGCAICGTTNPVGEGNTSVRTFSFAVDHCHESGKIRGLLCNPCNRGIGFLNDSPVLLKSAIEYLEAYA